MRQLNSAIIAVVLVSWTAASFAQSTTAPAVQSTTAPAAPVPSGKRMACREATQALTGQARRDQMQLCLAQARLDCLKQAIIKNRRSGAQGFCEKTARNSSARSRSD